MFRLENSRYEQSSTISCVMVKKNEIVLCIIKEKFSPLISGTNFIFKKSNKPKFKQLKTLSNFYNKSYFFSKISLTVLMVSEAKSLWKMLGCKISKTVVSY